MNSHLRTKNISSLMESSNNYRRRGRRTDVIGHISKHTRLLRKWHQDFRRTAKYVGIDSTCLKIISTADGRCAIHRRKCDFSNVYFVTTSRPIAQQKWKTRIAAVRQKTFISYKTLFPSDSRWEPRRKLFWNPRTSTSPGMIRFSQKDLSLDRVSVRAFARPKRIIRSFSRYHCERETNGDSTKSDQINK